MQLTKFHALGNDFLIRLDDEPTPPIDPNLVRQVCDRRRGVGADGLFHVTRQAGGAISQVLVNADGSHAEMSGNGIRCVALSLWRAGWWDPLGGDIEIATVVGPRRVTWVEGDRDMARFMVAMGEVRVGDQVQGPQRGLLLGAWTVDVGNPHEVHLLDGDSSALSGVGMSAVALDRNIEFVVRSGVDAIAMRVHERGVGETEACGTGSCASAAVARAAGWVGDTVKVRNPGGTVEVDLSGSHALLTGEAVYVAEIEWGPQS